MRLDLVLCRLRFVRTRSAARSIVESGYLRLNGQRVERAARAVAPGDVLTIPRGQGVVVIQLESLPERRGPPCEAQSCYSLLDREGPNPLAAPPETNGAQGTRP